MIRNEKTGRFESATNVKATTDYGYYSKILNKPFDTIEELREAEEVVRKQEEDKRLAAEAKKAEAAKVEEAFKALNAAKRAYNESVMDAKKAYLKLVTDAKEKLNETLTTLDASLDAAEKVYAEELEKFNKAHPEGYHVTLKDGDNTTTISRQVSDDSDFLTDFFNYVLKNF